MKCLVLLILSLVAVRSTNPFSLLEKLSVDPNAPSETRAVFRKLLSTSAPSTSTTTKCEDEYPRFCRHAHCGLPLVNQWCERTCGVCDKMFDYVPKRSIGPKIDPAKGYALKELAKGVYWVGSGLFQSMFLVYNKGVVVVDMPYILAKAIPAAIVSVTKKPITHLIYSHHHYDHIGGTKILATLGIKPKHVIAHESVLTSILESHTGNFVGVPLPNRLVHKKRTKLRIGKHRIFLDYHGRIHSDGDLFIYLPKPRILYVVDMLFGGWVPALSISFSQRLSKMVNVSKTILAYPFRVHIGGHISRPGSRKDIRLIQNYLDDARSYMLEALKTTVPKHAGSLNKIAVAVMYVEQLEEYCAAKLMKKYGRKLGGANCPKLVKSHCRAMWELFHFD